MACSSPGMSTTDRAHYKSFREYLNDVTADAIDDLKLQDPSDRIQFLMDAATPDTIRKSIPGIVSLESHLIPTWTIMARFLNHHQFGISGDRRLDAAVRMSVGCTITAVPDKDHWAHGIMLCDDVSDIIGKTTINKRYQRLLPSRELLSEEDSPLIPFAHGYPRLGKTEYRLMVSTLFPPTTAVIRGIVVKVKRHFLEGQPVIACPLYRMVYRAKLSDGSHILVDPARRLSNRVVGYKLTGHGGIDWSPIQQTLESFDGDILFGSWIGKDTTSWKPWADKNQFAPISSLEMRDKFKHLLYACCEDQPWDWESDDIIAAGSALRKAWREDATLANYINSRTSGLGNYISSDPREQAQMEVKIRNFLNLSRRGSSLPSTFLPIKESARLTSPPGVARPPPKPRPAAQAPPPLPRRSPPPDPKPSPPPPPKARKLPKPKSSSSTMRGASSGTESTVKVSQPDPSVPDPKGLYSLFGISPTSRYLDGQHAAAVDRLLVTKRTRLSAIWHPDKPTGDAVKMQEINTAFDQIKSLSVRLEYQRKGKKMK